MTGKQNRPSDLQNMLFWTALLALAAGCSPPGASAPTTRPDSTTAVAPANASSATEAETADATSTAVTATDADTNALPRLLDLGAGKCIPCKMMAPILDEMKERYAGTLQVDFIDVWENPDEAKKYGVESIPTQIFFDTSGKELFRHVGFFAKEDILAKWEEFGVDLEKE